MITYLGKTFQTIVKCVLFYYFIFTCDGRFLIIKYTYLFYYYLCHVLLCRNHVCKMILINIEFNGRAVLQADLGSGRQIFGWVVLQACGLAMSALASDRPGFRPYCISYVISLFQFTFLCLQFSTQFLVRAFCGQQIMNR